MRLVLAAVLAVIATAGTAHADGIYFTEGGGSTHWKNEISAYTQDTGHFRVALGYRHDRVAVEVWGLGELAPLFEDQSGAGAYGLDVKWLAPLSKHVELYARGSVSRLVGEDRLTDWSGRGLGAGVGAQIKARAPLLAMLYPPIALLCLIPGDCKKLGPMGTIALWGDVGSDFYRLHNPTHAESDAIDAQATRWTVGIAFGSDF